MERSIWLVLLGLGLILVGTSLSKDRQTIADKLRPIPALDGAPPDLSLHAAMTSLQGNSSPCDNPTLRIELLPEVDLQEVIAEAPPGSVIELQQVAGHPNYRVPEQGLVIDKDLALCGNDPSRIRLRGPVSPNPSLEKELFGQSDNRNSAMLWIIGEEPITVWLENVALGIGVEEETFPLEALHNHGILVTGRAEVVLRNVKLLEHGVGLGVIQEARATLEDVGLVNNQATGIAVSNEAQADLTRVRILGSVVGLSASRNAQVTLRDSWILDNASGISAGAVAWDQTVQVVVERTWIVGNYGGVIAEGADFAPRDERTRDWFPVDITLRQSRILSNVTGVEVTHWSRVILEDSEVAYNGEDGLLIDVGIAPSEGTTTFHRGGSLVLIESRIHDNGRYGIALQVRECGSSIGSLENAFLGYLEARDSEIFANRQGDLCPEDYPWPEGFKRP